MVDKQKRILGQTEYIDNLTNINSQLFTSYEVNSSTYVTIPGSSYEFTLSESATVIITMTGNILGVLSFPFVITTDIAINVDGTEYLPAVTGTAYDGYSTMATTHLVLELGVGDHTIKAVAKSDDNGNYVSGRITTTFLQIK